MPSVQLGMGCQEDRARCREIARELQVSILSYDYSGYGCSTGALSVANTLADIDAAYEWLLAHGRRPSDVILYGAPVPLLAPPTVFG